VSFDQLGGADLVVDRFYYGGRVGNSSDDPVARLLPVGNQGGFRYSGSLRGGTVRLVVLVSSGRDPDWPDVLDTQTGTFTYYGDNKSPGRDLHDTTRGGNVLLRDAFAACHGDRNSRSAVPPFLLFTNTGTYRDMRFRGLLVPGSVTSRPDDDLQAIWRSKKGLRFQNYRARFSVLDHSPLRRDWIEELILGHPLGPHAPAVWRKWVEGRSYQTLVAKSTTVIRTRDAQTPTDAEGQGIIVAIHTPGSLAARPTSRHAPSNSGA